MNLVHENRDKLLKNVAALQKQRETGSQVCSDPLCVCVYVCVCVFVHVWSVCVLYVLSIVLASAFSPFAALSATPSIKGRPAMYALVFVC